MVRQFIFIQILIFNFFLFSSQVLFAEVTAETNRSGGQEQTARMSVIKLKDNESFEQAMKRFKKTVEKAGTLTELRRREYYDKPSIRKKKKAAAARKRALKKMRRMAN